MGISFSLLIAAAGAILIWAVHTTASGFNIHTAGVILLVVGVIGFLVSIVFWSSWGGFSHSRTEVVESIPDETVIQRRSVIER
jgi:hypothetical protein